MLLPDLPRLIEEESIFNAISIRAAPVLLRSDLIRSKDLRTRLPFGIRNTTTVYQKAMQFETLSVLEEDLDCLLKIGNDCSDYYMEATSKDHATTTSTSRERSVTHRRLL
jgi:hypothetical protein